MSYKSFLAAKLLTFWRAVLDGSGLTATRTYTLPDASGTLALVSQLDNSMSYLTTIYGDSEAYAFVLNTQGLTTAQLNTWLNSQTRINQFTTLLNSHATTQLIVGDTYLLGVIMASTTAMTAIAASTTMMSAIAANTAAMTSLINNSSAFALALANTNAMIAIAASSLAITSIETTTSAYIAMHNSATAMASVAVSATAMGVIAASATYLANLFTSQVARRSLVTGITDWGTNAALDAIRNSTTAMTWLRANKVIQVGPLNNTNGVQDIYNGKSIAVEWWNDGNYGNQGVPSGWYVGGIAKQTSVISSSTPTVAVMGAVGQLQCKDGYIYTYCKYVVLD